MFYNVSISTFTLSFLFLLLFRIVSLEIQQLHHFHVKVDGFQIKLHTFQAELIRKVSSLSENGISIVTALNIRVVLSLI